MPTQKPKTRDKRTSNELAAFLESLDKTTRELVIKCLHLHGEEGDVLTDKQKIDRLRAAL